MLSYPSFKRPNQAKKKKYAFCRLTSQSEAHLAYTGKGAALVVAQVLGIDNIPLRNNCQKMEIPMLLN